MTLLGIVAAMKTEARCLIKSGNPMPLGELLRLPSGTLLNLSGIGPDPARRAAKRLLEGGATALLSWGTAGALDPTLSTGDLILPEKILLPNQISFAVNSDWHERLCSRLRGHLALHTGSLIQSPSILKSPYEKKALLEKYGAIAVDMESGAVVETARIEGIPFMAIRAISDPSYMAIPSSALTAMDETGRLHPLRLLRSLARHPREIFSLVHLGKNFHAAQATLKTVLLLTGPKLLAQ